jgi:hypothetical protein
MGERTNLTSGAGLRTGSIIAQAGAGSKSFSCTSPQDFAGAPAGTPAEAPSAGCAGAVGGLARWQE